MDDLQKVHFDVIGLSETHCTEESHHTWKEVGKLFGAEILLGRRDETANKGGVGFIVHPRLKVQSVTFVSSRVTVLKVAIPGQRRPLKVVQVYAPHSGYDDEAVEQFYEELTEQLADHACRTLVIGDLNARIGRQQNGETYIGTHSADERNERGERLAAFAESHRLHVMNTFFEKPNNKRWTWHSPCFDQFNELDYVLCDDRHSITNVEVLGRFACDSDHRPVRATLHMDVKRMKKALALSSQKRATAFDEKALQRAIRTAQWTMSGRTNERYEQLTTTLSSCLKAAEVPKKKDFRSRLTSETRRKLRSLTSMRAQPENAEEYRALAREVRTRVKADHEAYRNQRLLETAEARRSIKKCTREIAQVRLLTAALKDENGIRQSDRREIERICGDFYTKLFDSKVHVAREPRALDDDAEPPPPFTWREVERAISSMKNGKAPGLDGITVETLKAGGPHLWKALAKLFSHCLKTVSVPALWKESKTVLIFKKGDPEDIANYRPICLLSTVYKVFTKTILNRLTETLDAAQPPEQAGFRSGYCTLDHLQTINQLQEKAREFGRHLHVVFIDYEKGIR